MGVTTVLLPTSVLGRPELADVLSIQVPTAHGAEPNPGGPPPVSGPLTITVADFRRVIAEQVLAGEYLANRLVLWDISACDCRWDDPRIAEIGDDGREKLMQGEGGKGEVADVKRRFPAARMLSPIGKLEHELQDLFKGDGKKGDVKGGGVGEMDKMLENRLAILVVVRSVQAQTSETSNTTVTSNSTTYPTDPRHSIASTSSPPAYDMLDSHGLDSAPTYTPGRSSMSSVVSTNTYGSLAKSQRSSSDHFITTNGEPEETGHRQESEHRSPVPPARSSSHRPLRSSDQKHRSTGDVLRPANRALSTVGPTRPQSVPLCTTPPSRPPVPTYGSLRAHADAQSGPLTRVIKRRAMAQMLSDMEEERGMRHFVLVDTRLWIFDPPNSSSDPSSHPPPDTTLARVHLQLTPNSQAELKSFKSTQHRFSLSVSGQPRRLGSDGRVVAHGSEIVDRKGLASWRLEARDAEEAMEWVAALMKAVEAAGASVRKPIYKKGMGAADFAGIRVMGASWHA